MRRHRVYILFTVLLVGFLLRMQALQWNWFMHGDVTGDAIVAAELQRSGHFVVFATPPSADPAAYALPPTEKGEPLTQHAPVWPLIGAIATTLRGGEATLLDAFLSLRLLSVLAGTLVILLSFFVTSRLLDERAGLVAATFVAVSYVLIDYSGNGAFYAFQGLIYLLWALAALQHSSYCRTLLLGFLAGFVYLVNFQAIILLPAGLGVLLIQERSLAKCFSHIVLFTGVAVITAAPWLIRNAVLFGDPLYSHTVNMQYVYGKSGFSVPTGGRLGIGDNLSIIAGIFHTWLPYNLYYAARKLFVIAPITFFFFAFGLIDIAFSRQRFRAALPLLAVLAFHILLSASWPIWKFRFFVPLLPFVFILALEELWHLPITHVWRRVSIGAMLSAMLVVGMLTYRSTPLHTTYYDGAITQDPFHGSEERTYLQKYNLLP